jgi:hypothetical protein
MSRQLPSHPSLEHLKKQANALLQELRQRDPAAQLADAQHALAREYGFASWLRLKNHVASVSPPHPLAGRWVANVAKSKRHPGNPFRSATIRIEVRADTVLFTDIVTDESGQELRGTNEVQADGVERETANGYAVTARWRSERVLETIARKDGTVVGHGLYEVSPDGTTLTVTSNEQLLVLERSTR